MHQKKLAKLLGLSMLAVVAVMAMNASAAQAKYNLVGGTEDAGGVLLLDLSLSLLLSQFLLIYIEEHLDCSGGTGLMLLQTNSSMTTLSGSGTLAIKGCIVVGLPACAVRSPGAANGELLVSLSGTASMSGSTTFMNMESEEFVTWVYEGELCPFNELEKTAFGSAKLVLTTSEASMQTHTGSFDDIELFFGEEPMEIHGANLATPMGVHATRAGGGNWAIQLTGL